MSNYYIEGNNGHKVSLSTIIHTGTSGTNGAVSIPNYSGMNFRYVNNRSHRLDCCRAIGRYYTMVNGVKKDIFDHWNIPAKSISLTNGGSSIIDFRDDGNYKGIKYVRVSLHGGGGSGGRGSSGSPSKKGGGGGGGAFVLSGLISTDNMKYVQIYAAGINNNSNGSTGGSSWFKAVYNDDTQAVLYAPGGNKGGRAYYHPVSSLPSGGSGGSFSSSTHNSSNFQLVQTLNGYSGAAGMYSTDGTPAGGASGWTREGTYNDLIGESKGSSGTDGRLPGRYNPTSGGAATCYVYM